MEEGDDEAGSFDYDDLGGMDSDEENFDDMDNVEDMDPNILFADEDISNGLWHVTSGSS